MKNAHVKRVLACLAITVVPALAHAQWWNSELPPGRRTANVPGVKIVYDAALRKRATDEIAKTLAAGDIAKLDRMHDEFADMARAGGEGRDMIAAFSDAFEIHYGARSAPDEAFFQKWRTEAPGSRLRSAAEAAMWWHFAWKMRGGGYASEVSPESMDRFGEFLGRAARALEDGQGRESPLWYWMALAVGGSLGAPAAAMDQVFDAGARKYPTFMRLYETRLNFLLPQWGGDYGRVDAFVRAAVNRTQATEGTVFYPELYAKVARAWDGENFFGETRASWRLMQHGFEEQVAHATVDLNQYAAFACLARDRETTALLLRRLGDKANVGVEVPAVTNESCAELVKEGR